jgi:hypothetical protein
MQCPDPRASISYGRSGSSLSWCMLGLLCVASCGEHARPRAIAAGADAATEGDKSPHDAAAPEPASEPDAQPVDAGADDDLPSPSAPDDASCALDPLLDWPDAGAASPDWSEDARVPLTGRPNPYGLSGGTLVARLRAGQQHALAYPVNVSSAWLPLALVERIIAAPPDEGLIGEIINLLNPLSRFDTLDEFEAWLGLVPFPDCDGLGAQSVPFSNAQRPSYRMGSTRAQTRLGEGLSYGCAGCHAGRLFGRSLLGLQNRLSRANVGVEQGRSAIQLAGPDLVADAFEASDAERAMLIELNDAMSFIAGREPLARGLDTSLAQVALSLAKRAQDAYATRDPAAAASPRSDLLDDFPADSKPGNWWVLKYKNRWLLDGSVVSGNPIFTNILWNEIGRGADLHVLSDWLEGNGALLDDLTAAVFAAQPPRISDFFPAERIDLAGAKRGKALFDRHCARCHGEYQKAWEQPGAEALPRAAQLATLEVRYHERTPVVDVGTDPLRYLGMSSLEQLNELAISQQLGARVVPQLGYVPPPLVGIWARFPYFHNNAAPSLCAVLTRAEDRPPRYYAGEPLDPERDFDFACNGYPGGKATPSAWRADPEALYDTALPGLWNVGHDEGIFLADGVELLSEAEKRDLISFLQTL